MSAVAKSFASAPHIFIFATPYGALPGLYYCLLTSWMLLMTAQKINIFCVLVRDKLFVADLKPVHQVSVHCCIPVTARVSEVERNGLLT